jgi:pimeloyl-ACP methyl ester carboxylesterase
VRPSWLQELYPFKNNFFEVEGNQLNYVDEGQGAPILMVHGNPTWSFYYRDLVKEFSKTNRVIAPDHIGCGYSDKPQDYEYILENHISNIEKLVDQLDLKEITLVVHDWGGAIGFGLATRHPELIKKVVILNTAAYTCDYIPPQIKICRTPILGEAVIRGFNAFAGPATHMAVEKPLSKNVKKGYLLPYNNYKNRIATAKFVTDIPMKKSHRSFKTLEAVEQGLSKITCPKLVLWGRKDFCFNDYFLNRWRDIYPEAKYKIFENAGHYVIEDESEAVIKEMRAFI